MNKLLEWLVKRRQSAVLGLVEKHLRMTTDAVNALRNAFAFGVKGNWKEANSALERLNQIEMGADNMRRKAMEELAKGELPVETRQDLTTLLTRMDEIADYARESGRILYIILPLNTSKEFARICLEICETNSKCALALMNSMSSAMRNQKDVLEACAEVERLEEQVDDLHASARLEIAKLKNEPGYVVLVNQFLEALESVADRCEDTADAVRLIAIGMERKPE